MKMCRALPLIVDEVPAPLRFLRQTTTHVFHDWKVDPLMTSITSLSAVRARSVPPISAFFSSREFLGAVDRVERIRRGRLSL